MTESADNAARCQNVSREIREKRRQNIDTEARMKVRGEMLK